ARGRPAASPLFPYTTLFRSSNSKGNRNSDHKQKARKDPICQAHSVLMRLCMQEPFRYTGNIEIVNKQHQKKGKTPHHINGKQTRSEEHTSELQSRENLVCRL